MMRWVYNDGGRKAAGFKGEARDCVTRAIAIAAEMPYQSVYVVVNELCTVDQLNRHKHGSARTGVSKTATRRVLTGMGWTWVPTMHIGSGCTVHLREDELPQGRLIVQLSKHVCAVVDGVIYDTHDPSRGGKRCVYGYWRKES